MGLQQSHTVPIERNRRWLGDFETEPYEAAWSREALFFVRALNVEGQVQDMEARVQISPDGIHWCDEGSVVPLPSKVDETTFVRVRHYGGWLRLVGQMAEGRSVTVIVHLVLKE
jgi:hypothetical protein